MELILLRAGVVDQRHSAQIRGTFKFYSLPSLQKVYEAGAKSTWHATHIHCFRQLCESFCGNTHRKALKYACEAGQDGEVPDIVILVSQSRSIRVKSLSGVHHQTCHKHPWRSQALSTPSVPLKPIKNWSSSSAGTCVFSKSFFWPTRVKIVSKKLE